jgi:hypothetical protein
MARSFPASLLAGALGLALSTASAAQSGPPALDASAAGSVSRTTSLPPAYDSYDQPGPSTGNYNTPEADGRPGEYYFQLGVNAFYDKDYAHAIAMYEVAASWAYKPAEFNLGLIYFQGLGVPVDRPRGAAWMSLAAERGNSRKLKRTRDLMLGKLSKAETEQALAIWQQLKPTYGDEVALARAKARWAQVKTNMTGSRVGDGAVHLLVGGNGNTASPGLPSEVKGQAGSAGGPEVTSGAQLFRSGQATDGSIAYQLFQQSDNPYDRIFRTDLTGTTSVGALTPVESKSSDSDAKKSGDGSQDR